MTDIQTKLEVVDAIEQRRTERRAFLRYAGGSAAAVGGLSLLAACGGNDSSPTPTPTPTPTATAPTAAGDADVLNFALNLEYLEAQFYSYAAFGVGLDASLLTGLGVQGAVTGGAAVPFTDPVIAQYAREIALDEIAHVRFLRSALTSSAVAQPAIDIRGGAGGPFAAAATAAGIANGSSFNPYADDVSFLYGAFIFEDVGVTAYKGASPLLTNKTYLSAAAGILAAEAYHAGLVRTALYARGLQTPTIRTNTDLISNARDSLDGARATDDLVRGLAADDDQGITGDATTSNIVPTNSNGLTYSRNTDQVLHIVYLTPTAGATGGGFFPNGVNGFIRTAAANPA